MAKMTEADWNEYVPPATNIAAAIQHPIDERWANRVLNAYLKDAKLLRRAALTEGKDE